MDDDAVIRSIADPGRRVLLDALRRRDGQTVSELAAELPELGRHAVLKHVGVLTDAGLLTTRKVGRRRHCHLNAVPLVQLARRWLDDYGLAAGSALLSLRDILEGRTDPMTDATPPYPPDHVSVVVVAASAEQVWDALTDPVRSARWFYGTGVHSTWEQGSPYAYRTADGHEEITGTVEVCQPPRLLVLTFRALWDDDTAGEPVSRVRWELAPEGEQGERTRVTLVHTGLGVAPATARAVLRGWPFLLSNLKTFVESGAPMVA